MPSLRESIRSIVASGDRSASVEPAGTFASVVRALLLRTSDARKVDAAIEVCRENSWLDPDMLARADPTDVEHALRTAGLRTLGKLAGLVVTLAGWCAKVFEVDDDERLVSSRSTEALREELRAIRGVGPASSDAILLEGLGRAAYPVDRATYRVLVRHGWIDDSADYDEARSVVEDAAGDDPRLLRQLSDRLEQIGASTCRASTARCERCALRELLPEGGPLGDV